MAMKKKIAYLVAFTFLMLLKASAFHVYTHSDSDNTAIENCSWCIAAVNNQQQELQPAPVVEVIPPFCPVITGPELIADLPLFLSERPFKSCLVSRPPPSALTAIA